MDFIQESGVKIPNAVIISGVTQTEQDEQVLDFLKKYGSIERTIFVDDLSSEYFQTLIVEFSHSTALDSLGKILPYRYTAEGEPRVVYTVRILSNVYTTQKVSTIIGTYLSELRNLAKLSGNDYGDVLKEMMSQIGKDIKAMSPVAQDITQSLVETTVVTPEPVTPSLPPILRLDAAQSSDVRKTTDQVRPSDGGRAASQAPSLSLHDMNPPEVQRVVVEHMVRAEGAAGQNFQPSVRLRTFSGKSPRPNNETDYDTWRSHIELHLNDPAMSPLQISRRILESLLSPAADVVKGLQPSSFPVAYLQLLDSAFGTVEDGEELFARFMNTLQDPGEKPSAYLQRLQLVLIQAVRRGGVTPGEVDRHLLKQFCRGCWDNTLLMNLQFNQKKFNPPSFPDLLLLLRTEEDRQQAKATLMRKHIGSTKQRVQVQSHTSYACTSAGEGSEEENESYASPIEDLRKQVASLQSQLTTFMSRKKDQVANKSHSKGAAGESQSRVAIGDRTKYDRPRQTKPEQTNRPRPWYCFNCGEDGHIAPSCTDAANPNLVTEKRKQLERK